MATPTPKSKMKWADAKKVLEEDLKMGAITPGMTPKQIYEGRAEFGSINYVNFRNNLNRLRKKWKKYKQDADEADKALQAFERMHITPPQTTKLRWDGSEAQRKLKQDMQDEALKNYTSRQLHDMRGCYQVFPMDQFRKHFHAAKRSKYESLYWQQRKKEKKRSKR